MPHFDITILLFFVLVAVFGTVGILVGLTWFTWLLYVVAMGLKAARDTNKLTPAIKVMGYPAFAVGWLVDLVLNLIVCTLLFWDLPREWMITSRLQRYKYDPRWAGGKRAAVASWMCSQMLDPMDPSGCHCKQP